MASIQFAPFVQQLIQALKASFDLRLRGRASRTCAWRSKTAGVRIDYRPYDPAFPEYGEPRGADLVCCIDVLEHIEPDLLDNVLDDLARITLKHGFF